jgi:hypothetical protein
MDNLADAHRPSRRDRWPLLICKEPVGRSKVYNSTDLVKVGALPDVFDPNLGRIGRRLAGRNPSRRSNLQIYQQEGCHGASHCQRVAR